MKTLHLDINEQIDLFSLMINAAVHYSMEVKKDYKLGVSQEVIEHDRNLEKLADKIKEFVREINTEIIMIGD